MSTREKEKYMTIRDAKRLLQVNDNEIKTMINNGRLVSCKAGTKIKITVSDFKTPIKCHNNLLNDKDVLPTYGEIHPSELEMISDWT